MKRGNVVDTIGFGPIPEDRRSPGLVSYTAEVPPGARARGFDTIVIAPVKGNDQYAVGHLLLDGFDATDAVLRERLAGAGTAARK